MFNRLRPAKQLHLALTAPQEEVSALPESRIDTRLFFEAEEFLARQKGQTHVDLAAELHAEPACGFSRAPAARCRSAIDDEDVAASSHRQVPGHARADDPGPDDDDLRVHGAECNGA